MRILLISCTVLALLPAGPAAQATGGLVAGRVVTLDTGAPLREAEVRLFRPGATPRMTSTGEDGRFEFRNVAAGTYTLSASRAGYVSIAHGQRRAFEPGRPLELAERASITNITIALPRGGAIAGRVVDDLGEPVVGAQVQPFRYSYSQGQRVLSPVFAGGLPTDDRGEFRLFHLAPADYYVGVMPPFIAGAFASSDEPLEYMRTYYPGVVSPELAQPVRLGIGEEIAGLTVPIVRSRTATLAGTVRDSRGRPATGFSLSLRETIGMVFSSSRTIGSTGPDGSFSISGIVPGQYSLEARSPATTHPPEYGSLPVQVDGRPLSGLSITMTPVASVRGRVVGPDGRPPSGLRTAEVTIRTVGVEAAGFGNRVTVPNDTWRFDVPEGMGPVVLRVQTPPAWTMRRILQRGEDITDRVLDLRRGDVNDVVVELTQNVTELAGSVVDARGAPLRDFVVVAFADQPARWTWPTRFVQIARADDEGRFTIRGLPPADYIVAAVGYLAEGEETDPARLEPLRRPGAGTALSLREGDKRTLTLRRIDAF